MQNSPQSTDGLPVSKINLKSDVEAKTAFIKELNARGFTAQVTKSPADITAVKNGQTHYFEIKYTARDKSYFGAATLTEWEAALRHEDHYLFVVATKRNNNWLFHEYTPSEFMEFSTVPPFKIFFQIEVNTERDTRKRGATTSVKLTRERLAQLVKIYKSFRLKE